MHMESGLLMRDMEEEDKIELLLQRHGEENAQRMRTRSSLSLFPPVDHGGKDPKQLPQLANELPNLTLRGWCG